MKISVVIPAYNAAAWIRRAVNSVLSQTRPADEIIVVDDGSTDGTGDIVRMYDGRVRLLQQANAGAAAARNTGILAATGDWIAFLDADDEWLPQKLQRQTEYLQKFPDIVWMTGNFTRCCCTRNHDQYVSDTGAGKTIYEDRGSGDFFKAYLNNVYGNTDTMLIKKEILHEAGLFRQGLLTIEDDDLWFKIAYRHPRIGYVDTPLAIYHMGTEGSIMKTHRDIGFLCDFLSCHLAMSKQEGKYEDFMPCGAKLLKCWIHWSWTDERIYQIRTLIAQFGFLIPTGRRFIISLLTLYPSLTCRCMPLLRKMNKILKVPL